MKDRPPVPAWFSYFVSPFLWVAAIFISILYSLSGIIFVFPLTFFFDPIKRSAMHQVARGWGKALLAVNPFWKLEVSGESHIDPRSRYVIAANHQSLLDILVVLAALKVNFKFIAKQELFAVPFVGWHMALTGYVALERGNAESGRKTLESSRRYLKNGVSVLYFPEGTRSPDGRIHEFKTGAFKLAQDENVEVLPVVIDGTGDAIPKKSWRLAKHSCFHVSIGKPVRISGRDSLAAVEAAKKIRQEMTQQLDNLRRSG